MAPTFTPPNVLMSTAKTGLIPYEVGTLILKNTMQGSAVMQLAKYEEMTKPEKQFTYMADGIGAYWVGEGERIQTSKATWLTAKIQAKKLGVIIPVTKEFQKYTAAQFFEEIKPHIAEAFANKFDQAALWGVNSPYLAGQSIWADIDASGNKIALDSTGKGLYTELNQLLGLVEDDDGDPNGFTTIKSNKQLFRGVVDAQGRPMFNEPGAGAATSLLGQPVSYASKKSWDSTKAEIITGDWDYARYGILEGIEYSISEDATITTIKDENGEPLNLFERDMLALKATMHVGFMRLKEGNFAAITPKVVTP